MSLAPPSSTANVSKRTVPPPPAQPNAQQLQLCAKHHTFSYTHLGAEPRQQTHWHGFSYFWRLTQDFKKTGTVKEAVMCLAS